MKVNDIKNLRKLIEAFKTGITKVRGIRGDYLIWEVDDANGTDLDKVCKACAIGTAIVGAASLKEIDKKHDGRLHVLLEETFPIEIKLQCPMGKCENLLSPVFLMEELFEIHMWSRTKIANYFEKLIFEMEGKNRIRKEVVKKEELIPMPVMTINIQDLVR